MTHRLRAGIVLSAAAFAMLLAGVVAAAGTERGSERSHAERVREFWTPERMANAIPRDFEVDPVTGRIELAKPDGRGGGKPGGGGGDEGDGGTTAVTGEPWTGADAVFQTTGKVYFTIGAQAYVCSGSFVDENIGGRSIVLTAGHCVYDEAGGAFVENWMFKPDYQGSQTFANSHVASALVTTTAWSTRDFNDDYAFAVIAGDVDPSVPLPVLGIDFAHDSAVHAFGYPHASPYTGETLVYCAGMTEADRFGSTARGLRCDMTGGSSGGPWMHSFDGTSGTLTSVNSFKYRSGPQSKLMFGPQFDSYTDATWDAAVMIGLPGSGVATQLVAPPAN